MSLYNYDSEVIYKQVRGETIPQSPVYYDELKKEIVEDLIPDNPQLCTYEEEWIHIYQGGKPPVVPEPDIPEPDIPEPEPDDQEYATLENVIRGTIYNSIPSNYKTAILKGNTPPVQAPYLNVRGKNLFDGVYDNNMYIQNNGTVRVSSGWATTKNHIPVEPNKTYIQNISKNSAIAFVAFYDSQKNFISSLSEIKGYWNTFTIPSNCYFIKTCFNTSGKTEPYEFQIEEGTTVTSYEAPSSNILVVDNITLRSSGSVYDELNLLTGQFTQRIDENGNVLSQANVSTINLTSHPKPLEGYAFYESNALMYIKCPINQED